MKAVIVIFLLPIVVVCCIDSDVGIGMALLSLGAVYVINVIAETAEGKVGLLVLLILLYYAIAANVVMKAMGHPLFD
jgi:hypothetical protein